MEISVTAYAARQIPPKTTGRVRQLIAKGKIVARKIGNTFLIEETIVWPSAKPGPVPKKRGPKVGVAK